MSESLQHLLDTLRGRGNPMVEEFGWPAIIAVMLLSLFLSLLISKFYTIFYGKRSTGSQIHRAFPLLGVSITSIFISVQFSLPLSLGLLGALSIVRFRTPIKEPEEIGFLMVVIACSIGCATFNLTFVLISLTAAVGGLAARHWLPGLFARQGDVGTLVANLPADVSTETRHALMTTLQASAPGTRLTSMTQHGAQWTLIWALPLMQPEDLQKLERSIYDAVPGTEISVVIGQVDADL